MYGKVQHLEKIVKLKLTEIVRTTHHIDREGDDGGVESDSARSSGAPPLAPAGIGGGAVSVTRGVAGAGRKKSG